MSVNQFLALSEQTLRNAINGSPSYLFYPIKGKLEPVPDYKESPVKEWRGADTAQGDVSDERTSTAWKYGWESRIYPGPELVLLLTHLFGYAAAPVAQSAPNAAANSYIFRTATDIFGDDGELDDKAIALIPNTGHNGTTYSQSFIGGRIKDADFSFKGGEAAEMKLNFIGGPWIGAPGQTTTAGMSFPAAKAFRSVPKLYIGAGATLTGTAPDYTNFVPNTMTAAKPDDLTIKLEPGTDDVFKMNGEEGPSVTERKNAWKISIEFTIDFADPSSGWSSYDAWVAHFAGLTYVPVMMTLDNGEIIAACAATTSTMTLYLPKMKLSVDPADRKNDGSKEKIKVKLESRIDSTVNVAAYLKLIA